jgi:hypothetical protein
MKRRSSSIASELGWLAAFLALFVATLYLVDVFVVPHHFNAKIGIVFAGFVAAVLMVALRARFR